MYTTKKPWPNSMYGGGGIKLGMTRSIVVREARAKRYRENIEQRQVALPEDSLIAFSPYRIVRLARVQCWDGTDWKVITYAYWRTDLRRALKKDRDCTREHRIGQRVWGVIGRQESPIIQPMVMEWFHDILMARVLRDDMNLKAATAIMARER